MGENSVLGSCRLSPAGEGIQTAGSLLNGQREEGGEKMFFVCEDLNVGDGEERGLEVFITSQ